MSTPVEIIEVSARDGLQNEDTIPVEQRVALIDALSGTGLRAIEAASFVHPKAIPPMAGSGEVMAAIERNPGHRQLLVTMGEALRAQGSPDRARPIFRAALHGSPGAPLGPRQRQVALDALAEEVRDR